MPRHPGSIERGLPTCASAQCADNTQPLPLLLLLLLLQDFANMPVEEVRANINSRRDKIFLLMEELRRLRIQQRLKVRHCLCVDTQGKGNESS